MLKGHVFSQQIFESPIFALFVNTFLDGANGISDNYKNGMAVTYLGSDVTIDSGAVCIQGRYLEENTSTTISAGTENMYCKLVIEIDLDKTNTANDFQQGAYKILKNANAYPALTQNNIVKNNAGKYQYELARFRTSANGISDFQDMRTFLDLESIFEEFQEELEAVKTEEGVALRSDFATLEASLSTPLTPHSGIATISYPTGFNKNNTAVISAVPKNNSNYNFNIINKIQYVQLNDDNIFISYLDSEEDVTGKIIEITIIKK